MDNQKVAIGFALYLLASMITGLVIAPMVAPWLATFAPWLAFAGVATSYFLAGIVSFPILVLTFYAARAGGVDGEIPEAG